jgi:hypothetical protein
VRVPLLVRGTRAGGEKGAGRSVKGASDAAVSLVDLPAITLDGASGLTPRASRLHASISMPSVVALPHQCDRVWRGVRTKTRKLVLNADGSPWFFFDLGRDPLEMKNLAADPESSGEMSELAARAGLPLQSGLLPDANKSDGR